MIKPELEFVYEAGGELEAPREIGRVVDGTRRIIPILSGVTSRVRRSAAGDPERNGR